MSSARTMPSQPDRPARGAAPRAPRLARRHRVPWAWALGPMVALLLLVLAGTAPGPARADDDERKNFVLSELIGKRLLRVQELVEEERYAEAIEVVQPLTERSRLKPYDRAEVFKTYGFMLAAVERYGEATKALETALSIDYLPEASMQSLRYSLAQLHMANEEWQRAIALLEEWMQGEEKPNAQAEFLITAAYAQTEQWRQALPHARRSVALSGEPVEQRLRMALAVEFQNGNAPQSLELLKQLVTHFPRKAYFVQLAAAYSNLGEESKALAVLELADRQGMLDQEREVKQLAQRYMFEELPWPAARTMRRGLESGVVEPTADNYELLANALLNAREYDEAVEPLERAAELSEDGNLYVRLAQVHLEVENWAGARDALAKAVEKGGLRDPGNAHLLLGISNFNENRLDSARSAFENALADEDTAESARKWIEHVDRAARERAQL